MKIRVFLRFKAELSYDSFKMNQQEKEKESYNICDQISEKFCLKKNIIFQDLFL